MSTTLHAQLEPQYEWLGAKPPLGPVAKETALCPAADMIRQRG